MKLFSAIGSTAESLSNTIEKALIMTDNVIDGTTVVTEMYKNAMQDANYEHKLESFKTRKSLLKDAGLSPEELSEFNLQVA